ncbi:hypothetical protein L3Q82_019545, partial [Scortum barcoo]
KRRRSTMPTKNVVGERISKFKNKGKDPTKLREKRISECVELRKAHKNESFLKRRNLTLSSLPDEEALSPDYIPNEMVALLPIGDIIKDVNSDSRESQTRGCQAARKLLSLERNPPLKEIIDAGLLSRFVSFLSMDDEPTLQFEAAWALTNIASGTSWHTQQVVEHGAVPAFIALLASPMLHISEQAVWALGNIAGDGSAYRDVLIECNVIPALLARISPETPVGYLRNLTWTLSNLCRNKNPFPPLSAVLQMLPSLIQLLHLSDKDILSDACWAISYLSDGDNDRIDVVVERTGIVPRLVELMGHEELSVMTPALRSIGNIVSGSDLQTQMAVDGGVLNVLPQLMRHPKASVQKEAAWALSNIAAGPCKQIQQLITCGLLPPLVELLRNGDFKTQREAVWAVTNFTSGGTVEQVVHLVQSGALEAIINLLQVKDAKVILVILDAINNMFMAAEKLGETEKLSLLVEELGGLDRIEMLQNHDNDMVYQAAHRLIEKYFGDLPEQDNTTAPLRSSGDASSPRGGKVDSLKASYASVQVPSGLARLTEIPLSLCEDSVDDMYYGCTQRMLINVKRHYLPRSTKESLNSTYTKQCALRAMKNKDVYDPLSWNHFRALCAYTAGAYYDLNRAVRNGRASYKTSFEFHALHFLLSDALRLLKLNQRTCYTAYRRSRLLYRGESGQTIRFGSFASSSLNKDLRQFGRRTCFEIHTCFGAYLKFYTEFDSDEDEVLIPPYEMFNIVSVDTSGENDLDCEVVYKLKTAGVYSRLNCQAVDLL